MQVKVKKLNEKAVIPSFSHPGDAGLDMTAISESIVDTEEYGYIEYGTGIAIQLPENTVGLLVPRSSVSNTGLILSNCCGILDETYIGEVKFRFKYIKGTKKYEVGDRIGQLVIIERPSIVLEEVEELVQTSRAEAGFGSTGS